jgi:hydrogenase nickel incorporation protein HypA/HybF
MHEAALIQNLISIAEKTIKENNIKHVNSITLSVGRMSNAMPDALIFAYEAFTQNSSLNGAELIINEVPIKVRCERCGFNYEPDDFPFICPECRSNFYSIIQGEDIYIESLDCEV